MQKASDKRKYTCRNVLKKNLVICKKLAIIICLFAYHNMDDSFKVFRNTFLMISN